MNKRSCFLALALFSATVSSSFAIDTIYTNKGKVSGEITQMDPQTVSCKAIAGGQIKQIAVNEIVYIDFTGDPLSLKAARKDALSGEYTRALERFADDKSSPDRPEVKQDMAYFKAYCIAKLALGGADAEFNGQKITVSEAGSEMLAFTRDYPQSYHHYDAVEIVGDLLAAKKLYSKADAFYRQLEKTPWTDYKMRAGVAIGRSLLAQGKLQEASAAFDKVMAEDGDNSMAQAQKLAAYLGKAEVLIAAKKPMDAAKLIESFLLKNTSDNTAANAGDADKDSPAAKGVVENSALIARAYNILGKAERQSGHTKAAVLAFLHVDLLYGAVADADAEALSNLADLWGQLHRTDRADAARKALREKYPQSRWCLENR